MSQQTRKHFQILKNRHVTEKSVVLEGLKDADSNPSVRRCENPKYVFIVDPRANKKEIAEAVESVYNQQNVKVISVNTVNVKPKKRRVRGRLGKTSGFKKAIVTLEKGDVIDNV